MVVETKVSIVEKIVWITERFFDNHYKAKFFMIFSEIGKEEDNGGRILQGGGSF